MRLPIETCLQETVDNLIGSLDNKYRAGLRVEC